MISPYLTRKIPPPHPIGKTKSDPQRSQLYIMEREFMGVSIYHVVSRRNLQVITDHACRYYRIPTIEVVVYNDPKGHSIGEYERDVAEDGTVTNAKIRLNRCFHGANTSVLLHELAHYITHDTYCKVEPHGPEFASIYMHLLDKYRIMPSDCFRLLAKRCNVRISILYTPAALRG